jgi:hypothetical protein
MTSICSRPAEVKAAERRCDRDPVTPQAVLDPHRPRARRALRPPGRFRLREAPSARDFTGPPATAGLGRLGGARDDPGPRRLLPHTRLAAPRLPGPGPDRVVARVVGLAHPVVWARTPPPSREEHGRRPSPTARLGQEDRERRRWSAVTDHRAPPPPRTTWVVVPDRERDRDESILKCIHKKVSCVIRAQRDRVTADDDAHRCDAVAAAPVLGRVAVALPRRPDRPPPPATLTWRAPRRSVPAPDRPGGRPAACAVTVLEPRAANPPAGVAPVSWARVTDRVRTGVAEGSETWNLEARREGIEEFHRVLKTGLGVETSRRRGVVGRRGAGCGRWWRRSSWTGVGVAASPPRPGGSRVTAPR